MISTSKYPFIRCLNPQKIYNKYLDKTIVAPCGKCEACLLQRSAMSTLKCRLESEFYKYCYFITLTYNEDNIPLFHFFPKQRVADGITLYEAVDTSLDTHYNGYVLGEIEARDLDVLNLQAKSKHSGDIAYLRQRDVQLFMKRLRKYIKYEKVRYYCAGEYGPIHYRPHWHLLLWFNDEKTAQNLREVVSKAWRLGFIHVGKSSGAKAASYVAGYVNSRCSVPSLFDLPETKSKSTHSTRLGEKIVQDSIEEVYEQEFRDFVKRSWSFSNGTKEFGLWRSLKARFFPKCVGFTLSDSSELYESYTIVTRLRYVFELQKPYEIAIHITNRLYDETETLPYDDNRLSYLVDYYLSWISDKTDHIRGRISYNKSYWDKLLLRIYRILSVSSYFVDEICHGDSNMFRKRINDIIGFYSKEELFNIGRQIESKESILTSKYPQDEKWLYLDDLSQSDLECILHSYAGSNFNIACQHNWQNAVKHKKQNDMIDMFHPDNLRYNSLDDNINIYNY